MATEASGFRCWIGGGQQRPGWIVDIDHLQASLQTTYISMLTVYGDIRDQHWQINLSKRERCLRRLWGLHNPELTAEGIVYFIIPGGHAQGDSVLGNQACYILFLTFCGGHYQSRKEHKLAKQAGESFLLVGKDAPPALFGRREVGARSL